MKVALISIFFFFASACYSSDIKIIHASDGSTLNNKPATSVYFGESQQNFCNATIPKHLITSGYKFTSKKRNNRDIDIDCNWNGKSYTPSTKHKTFYSLKIKNIDKNKKTITIIVDLNLIDYRSNEFLRIENVQLNIKQNHFNLLVK